MRAVPWWGVVSSAAAPVLMVGGWTLAAGLQQPQSYSQLADTVSALAAPGATDRWVMTVTFLVVGACDAITGLALRPARTPGRLILMCGAVAGTAGGQVGLAERVFGAGQALWPLAVVASCQDAASTGTMPSHAPA